MIDKSFVRECRLCTGDDLKEVLSFGKVPLGNDLGREESESLGANKFPLEVFKCGSCGHFQLGYAVDPSTLFAKNYTYLSGVGASFSVHMDEFVDHCLGFADTDKPRLLEVGCNDGTLLNKFSNKGYVVKGVDPAEMPAQRARDRFGLDVDTYFFDANYVDGFLTADAFDLVVSQNVFAHVNDLRSTLTLIRNVLKPGGHLVFEVGYFARVVEDSLFDTIYHEHLDYHTAGPLARLLNEMGFCVVDLQVNGSQGGSLRVTAKKDVDIFNCEALNKLKGSEQSLTVENVRKHMGLWLDNARAFGARIKEIKSAGSRIIGYGSPTKCVLFISLSNIGEYVDCIIEDNAEKQGLFLPQTGIKLVDYVGLDYNDVVVVFAWNFFDDIVSKLKSRGFNGRIIKGCLPFEELAFA